MDYDSLDQRRDNECLPRSTSPRRSSASCVRLRSCWAKAETTAEACRRIAVSEQTYYRWRKEYGGLKTDQARRMKDLEKENLRLRRAISDLTLDKLILQEAAKGNF